MKKVQKIINKDPFNKSFDAFVLFYQNDPKIRTYNME